MRRPVPVCICKRNSERPPSQAQHCSTSRSGIGQPDKNWGWSLRIAATLSIARLSLTHQLLWSVMYFPEPQFARSDVLRIFNHAQIYLFLGSAIITVGLLAASFSLLRRRFDALLLWFALFAILYGVRL